MNGGKIGVGKTTFTEIVAEKFGWQAYYESVIDISKINPTHI